MCHVNENLRKFTFVDLFCGIGGFHSALADLGGTCVFASDIDAEARTVYESNYAIKPVGDIREVRLEDIPNHDVLCAGFPCQPFSKGGPRLGFKDKVRGTLFFEIIRIVEAKRPRFVILENVKNLATHDGGGTWSVIVDSLQGLGYRVNPHPIVLSPHLLSPVSGGAPQHRERVIILAEYIGKTQSDTNASELSWNLSMRKYPSPQWDPNSWDMIRWMRDHPPSETNLSQYMLTSDESYWLKTWGAFAMKIGKKVSGSPPVWEKELKSRAQRKGIPLWKQNINSKNRDIYLTNKNAIDTWRKTYKPERFPDSKRKFEWQAQDSRRRASADIMKLLIQFRPSGVRVKKPTYCGAIVAMVQTPIAGWLGRHLTPSEVGTLQGFSTEFKRHSSDKIAYKQFGNAVNVNVIKFAAMEMFEQSGFWQ